MPACWRCGRVQSSAEVRRTPRGHVCKDNGRSSRCAQLAAAAAERKARPQPPVTVQLLTLQEAARVLGCSTTTVKRRVRGGDLPAFRDGRLVRIREDDLRRFISERVARGGRSGPTEWIGAPLPQGARLWD